MNCLTDRQLQILAESKKLSVKSEDVEAHLSSCNSCKEKYERYRLLELELNTGIFIEPPDSITKFVMKKILSQAPSVHSVFISIIISFFSIILMTLTYYGFSKEGVIKSVELFGNIVFNALHSIVIFLSNLLDYSIIFIKTLNKFTKMVLGVGADIELLGLSFIVALTLTFFVLYKLTSKARVRREI